MLDDGTASPAREPSHDEPLVVMGVYEVDPTGLDAPRELPREERVQDGELPVARSRGCLPVEPEPSARDPVDAEGRIAQLLSEMVGDDMDVVPAAGECLGEAVDPDGSPSRQRGPARGHHGDPARAGRR